MKTTLGKETLWNAVDIDRLLKEFAASPRAAALRDTIKSFSCPDPEEIAKFCHGEWEDQQDRQFRIHLLSCSSCAEQVARLHGSGLPEELNPHPSEDLLFCYTSNRIPAGPLGEQLRSEIIDHLAFCSSCREQVEQSTVEILHWAELSQTLKKLELVRQLVHGLGHLAKAQLVRQAAARAIQQGKKEKGVARGVKRGDKSRVNALVCDEAGQLLLDSNGEARTVQFEVIRAEIDKERGLFVQLLTAEEPYCLPGESAFTVQVSLKHGAQCLCFPPVAIRPDKHSGPRPSATATLRAKLMVDDEVRPIPTETFRLIVQPQQDR